MTPPKVPVKPEEFLPSRWESKFLPHNIYHDIFNYFLDLPCHLIPANQPETWYVITNVRSKSTPVDYEFTQGNWESRVRYNGVALRRVAKECKPLVLAHQGLWGLFVPVLEGGRSTAVLQCGVFLKSLPTEADLTEQWKDLTGRRPKAQDKEFTEYVRTVLETPVLDPIVLKAVQEVMVLFAGVLGGSAEWKIAHERMTFLRRTVFARRLWHHHWVESVALHKKFFRFPEFKGKLMDWEKEVLGIDRFPSVVLAVKRKGTNSELSDLFAAAELQREAFFAAKDLEETLAYPLEHYGALLLTSATPGLTPSQAKLEIKDKVESFIKGLLKELKGNLLVGIGSIDPRGLDLVDSYHEAVAALHVAETSCQPLVFFGDLPGKQEREFSLRKAPAELVQTLVEEGNLRTAIHRRRFVEKVLMGTRGKGEATRRYLLEALHRLMETLEKRQAIEPVLMDDLESGIEEELESAPSLNEMVERFERSFEKLTPFIDRPAAGEKMIRLRKAQEMILSSLERTWSLPAVARQFGFSTTAFSREFSAFAGQPFSDYLLAQRLEKSKRMLLSTHLPLSHVSEACGFQSTNYFLQIFKKKVGKSPGKYRGNVKHKN
jgi:AraC-like DNA-binding protein